MTTVKFKGELLEVHGCSTCPFLKQNDAGTAYWCGLIADYVDCSVKSWIGAHKDCVEPMTEVHKKCPIISITIEKDES